MELEKEAEEYQRRIPPWRSDQKSISGWQKIKEHTCAARYEAYTDAVKKYRGLPIPALNPSECEYYSTEGVCCLPNTTISPYPKIAHVNTVLDFKFPCQLGEFSAKYINVYPSEEYGYSIRYSGPSEKIFADLYIYNIPAAVRNKDNFLEEELLSVADEINAVRQNAQFDEGISLGNFGNREKTLFLYFYATFDTPELSEERKEITRSHSFSMLFSKNQKFIKLRITQGGGTRETMMDLVYGFVADFDQRVVCDSQTREQKFEKSETPPIVLPD